MCDLSLGEALRLPQAATGFLYKKLYKIENAASSPFRYVMDPKDMYNAMKDSEDNDLDFMVFYHSHTHTPAFPSDTDTRMALESGWVDFCYALISIENHEEPVVEFYIIDSEGNIEWQTKHGDTRDEIANSIDITNDGGFIIVGEITNENTGNSSCYLIKVNNTGEFDWEGSFGGSLNDQGFSIVPVTDGGFVITGVTRSQNDSSGDLWLFKVNNTGQMLWEKTYGGENFEAGRSLQQTSDNGYIIIGHTESFGNGNNDAYLLKTDSEGNELWSRSYGGSGTDQGRHIVETLDQGYIISGYTDSYGSMGGFNFWLIKTDSNGDLEWQEYYGGGGNDRAFCGLQASDGGYAIVGQSNTGGSTGVDILLVKTDNIGNADPSQ